MNARRAAILELVTEAYIHSAHPVASAAVAERLRVSSATVRNEFAALEDEGFLSQPHTSAGRMPTARAYEHYASKFLPPGHLSPPQQRFLSTHLSGSHGEHLLERVAAAAAELSGYAVVVTLPSDDHLRALEIHLTALSSRRVLAVIVLENGLIRQLGVELDPPPDEAVLRDAESSLRQLTVPLGELPRGLADLAKRTEAALSSTLRALASALAQRVPARLYAQGVSKVLAEPESADPNFVRLLLERLEHPGAPPGEAQSLQVALERDLASVSACLPFGSVLASLMIVGPSRMRYRETLAVAHGVSEGVAQQLSARLN